MRLRSSSSTWRRRRPDLGSVHHEGIRLDVVPGERVPAHGQRDRAAGWGGAAWWKSSPARNARGSSAWCPHRLLPLDPTIMAADACSHRETRRVRTGDGGRGPEGWAQLGLDGSRPIAMRTPRMPQDTLDVAALRAGFSSLQHGIAHFDAPGGTQTPDAVADAIRDALVHPLSNRGRGNLAERNADDTSWPPRRGWATCSGSTRARWSSAGARRRSRSSCPERSPPTGARATRSWSPGSITTRTPTLAASPPSAPARPSGGPASTRRPVSWPWTRWRTALRAHHARRDDRRVQPDRHPARPAGDRRAGPHARRRSAVRRRRCTTPPHAPVDVAAFGADFYACSPYKVLGPHCGVVAAAPSCWSGLHPDKLARPATRSRSGSSWAPCRTS